MSCGMKFPEVFELIIGKRSRTLSAHSCAEDAQFNAIGQGRFDIAFPVTEGTGLKYYLELYSNFFSV